MILDMANSMPLSRLEVPGIVGFCLMWLESSTFFKIFKRQQLFAVPTPWCALSTTSHHWKLTAGTQKWRFGKWCSFSNWWLSSSNFSRVYIIESVAQTRGNMFISLYPGFIDRSYSSSSPTVETNRNRCMLQANAFFRRTLYCFDTLPRNRTISNCHCWAAM